MSDIFSKASPAPKSEWETSKGINELFITAIGYIDDNHQNVLWYSGNVATIKYKNYTFNLGAQGEVIAKYYDMDSRNMDAKVLAEVIDRHNTGEFFKRLDYYIDSDEGIQTACNYCQLEVDSENWFEVFMIGPDRNDIDIPDNAGVLESIMFQDAITEIIEKMDEWIVWNKKMQDIVRVE